MATTAPERSSARPPSGRLGSGRAVPLAGRAARLGLAYYFVGYRRTWRGSVFSRFLTPLFFLGMGLGLGALVDDSAGGVDGVPYLDFIAPGLLAVQAMQTAFGEASYPVFGAFKWTKITTRCSPRRCPRRGPAPGTCRRGLPPRHRCAASCS